MFFFSYNHVFMRTFSRVSFLLLNPFKPNGFPHLSIRPFHFRFYGCWVVFFIFIHFKRHFRKQTVENRPGAASCIHFVFQYLIAHFVNKQ